MERDQLPADSTTLFAEERKVADVLDNRTKTMLSEFYL